MSKINQIQQAILELEGGEFQNLATAYLVAKGFDKPNSIGSVVATNKVRKGTPDTLLTTPNGKYIFAEYTTQRSRLIDKMKSDLAKCFDECKTGVPVEKIERVVFCFTGRIDAEQENELAEICRGKGVNLDLFGIDALAFDLYLKYPGLAHDLLGIEIDTGQIVSLERFVSLYNNNRLTTRLDLDFHFREKELNLLLEAIEDKRLVIISGRPGVGKSRLALEACRKFNAVHPEYEVMCIFGRNRDLWKDLQVWFRRPGNFLIFVDDANRVSKFEYVVDVLLSQRQDQQIKVVATVRDYALSKVREAASPLDRNEELELGPFTDDQIKALITDEYGIRNHHYLKRIADIAQGNPRLAVMAAEIAKESPLSSIHDVSALYDSYFSSIREDLKGEGADLRDTNLLEVAAIVSFFKAVDRTNEEMMRAIEEAFGISPSAFWEAAEHLHALEVLDMHEDEVVRLSDQVLGTYIFYLATFKEAVLDFGALLDHFFPKLRHRLIDSINPVLSAFDSERVVDAMRPHVERIWSKLAEEGDEERLLHLLDVFWFTKRTDTLQWALERIDKLEAEAGGATEISFEKSSNAVSTPSILSVLSHFALVEETEARIALDLLSRYLTKRPSETPLLLRVLIEDYGFRPNSYLRGFEIQRAVMDVIWSHAADGNFLFQRLFLAVASNFLDTQFESHEMKNWRVLQITRFALPATPKLESLREAIWQRLFTLYQTEYLQKDVLELISKYSISNIRSTNSAVIKSDAEYILPFLESELDPDDYRHCEVLHDYVDLLERHDVEFPDGLRDRFRNDTYALAEILLSEWDERCGQDLSYEEYEQHMRDRLEQYTEDFTRDDYVRFFEQCLEICEASSGRHNEYRMQEGVSNTLLSLANRDPDLYWRVLKIYLELQDPLRLHGSALVQELVKQRGHHEALHILCEPEYPTKNRWLFHIHEVLTPDAVDEVWIQHLYDLYESAELVDLPHRFDYLLKYIPIDSRVVAKVVAMVLKKADGDPNFANALTMLFNPHTRVAKQLPDLFADDLDLLKQAYLAVEGTRHNDDHKGKVFGQLLDLDPTFVEDYIAWKYKNSEKGRPSSHDDNRDYAFIWARSDYQEVMDKVVDSIYEHERKHCVSIAPYLKTFFQDRRGNDASHEEIRKRQDLYLLRLIDERNQDEDFMEYLFGVISQFSPERRLLFVDHFVRRNESFDAFKRLPLEPCTWGWRDSMVPVLQGRVNYWESLLPIMNNVALLRHKQYVERRIQELRSTIETEKKNDFIGYEQ